MMTLVSVITVLLITLLVLCVQAALTIHSLSTDISPASIARYTLPMVKAHQHG